MLPVIFAIGCWPYPVILLLDQRVLGSHAAIYTDAARMWLDGGNPWYAGPSMATFAGPPPMLIPFIPFAYLPLDFTRMIWVGGSLLIAVWAFRRLGLPPYFLAFPPIFQVVVVGHPEMLVLWLLVLGGPVSGLATLVKPYAGVVLVAERRWRGLIAAVAAVLVTAPFLPWPLFVEELPRIGRLLMTQYTGDTVLDTPLLVPVVVVALAWIGLRRGLWLAVPLLWPYAQPTYQVMTLPALSPIVAFFWALPIPGSTFLGVVVEAAVGWLAGRHELPAWLRSGVGPVAGWRIPAAARVRH